MIFSQTFLFLTDRCKPFLVLTILMCQLAEAKYGISVSQEYQILQFLFKSRPHIQTKLI
jgi:hypothetical protein